MILLDDYKVAAFQTADRVLLKDEGFSSLQPTPTTPRFANSYTNLTSTPTSPSMDMHRLRAQDRDLKRRIRMLKVASRILAVILSIATLIPLLMTISKFLATCKVQYFVNGQTRTAWANNTITAYTYSYAVVIGMSLILNVSVLLAYCCKEGIRSANRVARVATTWAWLIITADIVILSISLSVYRYGKEPVDGRFRDLWGWTCSSAARELQEVLTSVDFDYYCNVQVRSLLNLVTSCKLS
jgi:hypothetical protein